MKILNERIWILLAKKKAGEASREELSELASLLSADTSSGYTSEIIDKIWDAPVITIPDTSIQGNVWDRIEKKTNGKKGLSIFRSFYSKQWMAAASLLLAVSAGIALYDYFGPPSAPNLLDRQKNMNHVATQPGSKSKLELPDGTMVWLNGDSKLTYSNGSFGKENREVILAGEAFFDVVKNEKVPFIIHTGPINITVKGTAFNVKAYPKEKTIETSLVRGLIEITTEQDPERKILLKPNEKIIIPVAEAATGLRTQDAADSTGGALYSITKWKPSANLAPPEIAWINNQLIFDDEPFGSIAPRMESWFHISIHFNEEELKKKRFSGVIEKETIKETLEAMQLSYHFQYQLNGSELWVGKK